MVYTRVVASLQCIPVVYTRVVASLTYITVVYTRVIAFRTYITVVYTRVYASLGVQRWVYLGYMPPEVHPGGYSPHSHTLRYTLVGIVHPLHTLRYTQGERWRMARSSLPEQGERVEKGPF